MSEARFEVRVRQEDTLTLSHAVLIYRDRAEAALATIHAIEEVDGQPAILPGKAMSARHAAALARSLAASVRQGGWLPENVLYLEGDRIVWWVAPHRQHIAFKTNETLIGERGAEVPHPGLVFAAARHTWAVWAVKGTKRPGPDTVLYRAPYMNTYVDGTICAGNVALPKATAAERIAAWNDAFFRSFFTHPNGAMVKYPGGMLAFWRDLLDGKFARFPGEVLIPAGTTLREAVEGKQEKRKPGHGRRR